MVWIRARVVIRGVDDFCDLGDGFFDGHRHALFQRQVGLPTPLAPPPGVDGDALGLDDSVEINPSGGALAANGIMVAGLTRIGEAANRIQAGSAKRALAHATSGPCLQQNLVCVLEGE